MKLLSYNFLVLLLPHYGLAFLSTLSCQKTRRVLGDNKNRNCGQRPNHCLYMAAPNATNSIFNDNTFGGPLDSSRIAGDLCALLVAFELKGLVDATNAPDFVQNGGWFQPPSISESTLPLLIQHFSINSIAWLVSGMIFGAFTETNNEDMDKGSDQPLLAFSGYAGLRTALAIVTGTPVYDLVSEIYFVGVGIGGIRFLQSRI